LIEYEEFMLRMLKIEIIFSSVVVLGGDLSTTDIFALSLNWNILISNYVVGFRCTK